MVFGRGLSVLWRKSLVCCFQSKLWETNPCLLLWSQFWIHDDPTDAEPLTPNHLLMLKSNQAMPPGSFSKQDQYSRRRWRQVQYLADVFWRRWLREYLPTLQKRQRWFYVCRDLKEDDLVLIVDENIPRGQWRLGRVVLVHKAKDGHVRSAVVKTRSGHLTRPISKLCLLENFSLSAWVSNFVGYM